LILQPHRKLKLNRQAANVIGEFGGKRLSAFAKRLKNAIIGWRYAASVGQRLLQVSNCAADWRKGNVSRGLLDQRCCCIKSSSGGGLIHGLLVRRLCPSHAGERECCDCDRQRNCCRKVKHAQLCEIRGLKKVT